MAKLSKPQKEKIQNFLRAHQIRSSRQDVARNVVRQLKADAYWVNAEKRYGPNVFLELLVKELKMNSIRANRLEVTLRNGELPAEADDGMVGDEENNDDVPPNDDDDVPPNIGDVDENDELDDENVPPRIEDVDDNDEHDGDDVPPNIFKFKFQDSALALHL